MRETYGMYIVIRTHKYTIWSVYDIFYAYIIIIKK